MTTEILFLL